MHRHDHDHARHATLTGPLLLTLGFAVVEAATGWWSGSLALMSDAGHMVTDAAALGLAAVAAWIARIGPSDRHSYGFGRAEVVAALLNVLFMVALVGGIAVAAVRRLFDPQPVAGEAVTLVAAVGLAVNIAVAFWLAKGASSINTRAALVHVMGDLLGSVGALVAGLVIVATGWTTVDPILSLAICLLILYSSLRLLREALHTLMEGVPLDMDLPAVARDMASVEGVASIHDLHIWALSSGQVLLSAHVRLHDLRQWETVLLELKRMLSERYGIEHATLQPEPAAQTISWMPRERE